MKECKRIVLLGSSGMLGQDLLATCRAHNGSEMYAFADRTAIDITNEPALCKMIREVQPDVIVNAAAFTDIDAAENHRDEAARVNRDGPATLADLARDLDALLVQFSTDHVFSGSASRSYRPDDDTDPVNWYGQTKLDGENAIRNSGCRYLIIRSSWLFAAQGRNFVQQILDESRTSESLSAKVDQRGRPTLSCDLADFTCRLITDGATGTFHVANQGDCTLYEFAEAILQIAGLDGHLSPVRTEDCPQPARRPQFSVLDLTETTERVGCPRHWRDALAYCMGDILDEPDDYSVGQSALVCQRTKHRRRVGSV